ncbi:glycoside hydrolase family 95 [Botrytis cinerea]
MPENFDLEIWIEYVIGISAFLLRFFARWKHVGFEKFALDDLFCFIGMTWHHRRPDNGNRAIGYPQEAHNLTIGSKCLFLAWICFITLTWTLKAILLSLYHRLTLGLEQHKMIKFVAGFCIISWTACMIAHFAVCVPIEHSWQVNPYPGDNCVLRRPNQALVGVLNILSYIGIMAIPLPLLFAARIPIYRKLILGALFCSGIFVTAIVILRVYYALSGAGSLRSVIAWAFRESFISIIAATAPGIKPLFNRSNWIDTSSLAETGTNGKTGVASRVHHSTYKSEGGNITSVIGAKDGPRGVGGRQYFELGHTENWPVTGKRNNVDVKTKELMTDSSSQEHIIPGSDDIDAIHATTDYTSPRDFGAADLSDSNDTEFEKNKASTDSR